MGAQLEYRDPRIYNIDLSSHQKNNLAHSRIMNTPLVRVSWAGASSVSIPHVNAAPSPNVTD